jgi:hypothetical protein
VTAVNRWTAALAFVACACLSAPALAAARVDNRSTTREYLRADEAYIRAASGTLGADVSAIEARAREIAAQCPGALTYAPRDEAFVELSEATSLSLLFAGLEPARPILRRFASAIEHLTWTNRTLTRLVHARAVEEGAIAALALPEVCADIAAWRASAYATLPPTVGAFVTRVHALFASSLVREEPRETVILRLLRRYEGPRSRRAAKRIEALEKRSSGPLEAAAAAALRKVATALGAASL